MVVLTVVCTFFSLLTDAIGQQMSTNLPIYSQAQLRNYGLSIAQFGWRQAYANSSPSRPYTDAVSEHGAEAILDSLFSTDLSFIGINTNDMIGDQIFITEGEMTQWGSYNYLMSGYTVYPFGTNPDYHLIWMQNIPLLMINNASSAQVDALRPDGTVAYTLQQSVVNGHPCLSMWLAGSENGNFVVHYLDGSSTTNQLSKPKPVSTKPAPTGHKWKIPGHYVLHATRARTSIKIVEQNNDPSVYIEVKNPSRITFDVMGVFQDQNGVTDTERPLTMEVDFVDGVHKTHKTIVFNADRPTECKFARGDVGRAYFTWNKFDKGNLLNTGDYGGGSEKGAAPINQ